MDSTFFFGGLLVYDSNCVLEVPIVFQETKTNN